MAFRGGIIESVDAARVIVRVNDEETDAGEAGVDIYNRRNTRSNQNTCISQRPLSSKETRYREAIFLLMALR